jgi:uncharacterized protein (DUF4415 family)
MASDRYSKSDNPTWTNADFKRARPASEALPDAMRKLVVRQKGRPAVDPADHKRPVSIRLHKAIIDHFKAEGPGWQTRLNNHLLSQIENANAQAENELKKAMAVPTMLATEKTVKVNSDAR